MDTLIIKRTCLIIPLLCLSLIGCSQTDEKVDIGLKDVFKDKFLMGASLNTNQVAGKDPKAVTVLKQHFNSVVAEDCMKSEIMQPKEGVFDFSEADKFVAFGEENGMFIIGHTLIWHSQSPAWFFVDEKGNDVSREILIERMRTHITTIMTHYKGRVHGWDVVNEAILDDGSYRESKFYKIIGEEYIPLAFKFASEADPEAELYYNDYSMAHEGRRQGVVNMVKSIQDKGIKIDGIGMQGHCTMDFPSIEAFEKSILAFAALNVNVMITELDLTILPSARSDVGADVALSFEYQQEMNPYIDGLPEDIETSWTNRYRDFFNLFSKHHDKISRVTLWGIGDANSWKNDWPIVGRTDYPLLFDRNYDPKPIVEVIMDNAEKCKELRATK